MDFPSPAPFAGSSETAFPQPDSHSPAAPPPLLPQPANTIDRSQPVAPWWHTAVIAALLAVYATIAHFAPRNTDSTPHPALYLSQCITTWMLLSTVVVGIYSRRGFFAETLRRRTRALWIDPAAGVAIYLSTFVALAAVMAVLTGIFMLRDKDWKPAPPAAKTQSATTQSADDAGAAAGLDASTQAHAKAISEQLRKKLHLDQNTVKSIGPRTAFELLLWTAVAFTAGFCEEHIFRGYLLHQTIAGLHRLRVPPALAAVFAVLATSVLFGSLHLYEGIGGAALITFLGIVYATMALTLGNLRAVIVAHFLQDFLGGVVLYLAHLRHAI